MGYVSPLTIATKFGIDVSKLEKIRNRSDCIRNIVDENGNWSEEIVGRMLTRMKKLAETSKEHDRRRRAEKSTDRPTTNRRKPKSTKDKPKTRAKVVKAKTKATRCAKVAKQPSVTYPLISQDISFESFKYQFWLKGDKWRQLIDKPLGDDARQLIDAALEFGYAWRK
jgi:hypothetical protein